MKHEDLLDLGHKNFAPETMKKVHWVLNMYRDWRNFRASQPHLQDIYCNMDDENTITKDSVNVAICKFITEVKKLDGTDFPGCTLYDIVISLQFHLETLGLAWKLLSHEEFKEVRFTLDNMMKKKTQDGIGISVKQTKILTANHEEILWRKGLLGVHNPNVLLNTVIFSIGKGCALRAGQEHRVLRSPPFGSQFQFMHDEEGEIFIRYSEDIGLKTNKGRLKHHKVDTKSVDIYPIDNIERCPVCIIMKYLSLLPKKRKNKAFYL